MAAFGRNMKITIDKAQRDQTRAIFEGALGCKSRSPHPGLDVYEFADGCTLGAFTVEGAEALESGQLMRATWAEFLVDDVDAANERLAKAGARSFEYTDKTHNYYQAPGIVFRIAAR